MEQKKTEERSFRVNYGILSILVILLLQILLFSFGYGMLTQQVTSNRDLIKSYQTNQISILDKLDAYNTRLTRIETILQIQVEKLK